MPFQPDSIHSRVVVESLDARRWKLVRHIWYTGAQQTFVIPAGYVTDFASVPRPLVWLIPTYGAWTRAAILHDWLLTDALPAGAVTSNEADGIFRRALRELGVPPVKRWLMWVGVRWGALGTPRRRAGWGRSAAGVVAITVLAAPIVAVPTVAVVAGLVVYGVVEFIATGGRKTGTLKT